MPLFGVQQDAGTGQTGAYNQRIQEQDINCGYYFSTHTAGHCRASHSATAGSYFAVLGRTRWR
jgi:hypothetical protein